MKGRNPDAGESKWHDKVATYGCYCCRKMGLHNTYILLHHCDGRTKPGAHYLVIPLCSDHHDRYVKTGFHYNPGAWRKIWGRENAIIIELFEFFEEPIPEVLLDKGLVIV